MQTNVLTYEQNRDSLIRIADKRIDNNDFKGALNILFNALENYNCDCELLERISYALTNLGYFTLSNKFLFLCCKYKKEKTLKQIYKLLSYNYFKLDNQILSMYYARLLYNSESFIDTYDDVTVLDYVISSYEKQFLKRYVSVYPNEENRFKLDTEDGMKCFKLGLYIKTIEKLSNVPFQYKTIKEQNALCESYLKCGDVIEFLNECKETISHFGENIKTYSLLYEFYENNKNISKTDYYYSKIKNLYTSDVEIESAVYPAIKQNDHLFLNEILRKLVLVSPEDIDYLFLLGKSYLNLGKYQLAKEQFITLFMLDRFSASYNYYLKLSNELLINGVKDKNVFPIPYTEEFPSSYVKKCAKKIRQNTQILLDGKKPANILNELKVALSDIQTIEDAVLFICLIKKKKYYDALTEFLLDPHVSNSNKNLAIVALIINGSLKEIIFTYSGIFKNIKTRKILFDQSEFGKLISNAYMLSALFLLSNNCFAIEKLTFNSNKIFKKYNDIVTSLQFTEKELASALIILSNDIFIDEEYVCKRFDVNHTKITSLVKIIKGKKHDKNN